MFGKYPQDLEFSLVIRLRQNLRRCRNYNSLRCVLTQMNDEPKCEALKRAIES